MRIGWFIIITFILVSSLFGCEVKQDDSNTTSDSKNKVNPNAQVGKSFGAEGVVLVTLSDVDKMAVIDLKTLELGDVVAVGNNPQDVTFSPDGKIYTVAMAGEIPGDAPADQSAQSPLMNNSIWTWDTTTFKIIGKGNISLNDQYEIPMGLAIDPTSNRLHIANTYTDTVLIRNLRGSQEDIARVTVGSGPRRVIVTPDKNYIISINTDLLNKSEIDTVSIIHALSHAEVARVEVGAMPWDGVVDNSSKKLYVSVSGSNCVKIIDIAEGKVVETFETQGSPRGIDLDSSENVLYIADYENDLLNSINLENGDTVNSIAVEKAPEEVCFSPNTNIIFVSSSSSKVLSIINVYKWTVIDRLSLQGSPSAIAVWDKELPKAENNAARSKSDLKNLIEMQGTEKAGEVESGK